MASKVGVCVFPVPGVNPKEASPQGAGPRFTWGIPASFRIPPQLVDPPLASGSGRGYVESMARVSRYELESELGRGMMGVVYLARDRRLGRQVAVKSYECPPGYTAEETAVLKERLLREARAAAVLSHPGIVTVYDADEDPERGTPFIAMEYVPGHSLQYWIKRMGRLDPERAFAIAETLADALDAAHASGIVHRDLKPANILVRDPDGAVKIADFGIAHLPGSELTQMGTTLGTPAYMSPEQVRGQPAGATSDLFSLAVILYECLCGERPFTGENLVTLTHAVVLGIPVPISRRVDSMPPSIDSFFDRALAKDPARRFPTGHAFREALNLVRSGAGPGGADVVGADVGEATVVTLGWNERDPGCEELPPLRGEGQSPPGPLPEKTNRASGSRFMPSWLAAAAALAAIALIVAAWGLRGGRASNSLHPRSPVASGEAPASTVQASAIQAPAPQAPPVQSSTAKASPARGSTARGSTVRAIDHADTPSASPRPKRSDLPRSNFRVPAARSPLAQTPSEAATRKVVLTLSVKRRVPAGSLWLTIDEDRVFSHTLAAPAGSQKLMNRLRKRNQETFETPIVVSPGRHRIVASVQMTPEGSRYEDSAIVDLKAGETRTLRVVAGRMLGAPLSLKVE